jgi:riboflavin kinase/FMN adenylyltransferase
MRVFRHFKGLTADSLGAAVAVGNFDGVHCGHQAVIKEAGRIAREAGKPWGVLTFEPHPGSLFDPGQPPFRLTPFRTKAHHIEELGVDVLVVLHFDKEFSKLSAHDFVHDIIVNGLRASHVVSGYDFVFGHGRQGHCDMLLRMGQENGYGFTCVQAVGDEAGKVYSSTRVRDCLKAGDVAAAAEILGREFEIEGRVEKGEGRGGATGFHTANLHLGEYQQPRLGVYAVRAGIDEGMNTTWRAGVANLGRRPTFDGAGVVLETHLFDFSGELYGRYLRVQFVDSIRPERKFDGIDALKAQIAEDCARARLILSENTATS